MTLQFDRADWKWLISTTIGVVALGFSAYNFEKARRDVDYEQQTRVTCSPDDIAIRNGSGSKTVTLTELQTEATQPHMTDEPRYIAFPRTPIEPNATYQLGKDMEAGGGLIPPQAYVVTFVWVSTDVARPLSVECHYGHRGPDFVETEAGIKLVAGYRLRYQSQTPLE